MRTGDVFVRRAGLRIMAPDASSGLTALHAAEAALPRALDSAGRAVGDEVLVVRRLSLGVSVWREVGAAHHADIPRLLSAALDRALVDARRRAKAAGASDAAWFPSLAAALGAYLVAVAERRIAWPFAAFRNFGTKWPDVLAACEQQGSMLLADVLAEVLRLQGPNLLVAEIGPDLAKRLVTRLSTPNGTRFLPLDESLWKGLRSTIAVVEGTPTRDQLRVVALAELFSRWPPARDGGLSIEALDACLPSEAAPSPEFGASTAGGLALWALLLSSADWERSLAEAYPHPRERRAVLWAVGRSLQAPDLYARDPILMAWCGETAESWLSPRTILAGADPEPLHAVALGALARFSGTPWHLRACRYGEGLAVVDDRGIVVDWFTSEAAEPGVESIVQRFRARTERAPSSLESVDDPSSEDLDGLREVDLPILPDNWRPAAAAVASAARWLLWRYFSVELRATHKWPARIDAGEIALRRRDTSTVAGGSWFGGEFVTLCERQFRIVVT